MHLSSSEKGIHEYELRKLNRKRKKIKKEKSKQVVMKWCALAQHKLQVCVGTSVNRKKCKKNGWLHSMAMAAAASMAKQNQAGCLMTEREGANIYIYATVTLPMPATAKKVK